MARDEGESATAVVCAGGGPGSGRDDVLGLPAATTAQHFRITGGHAHGLGLESATPELREKLARQLNKITGAPIGDVDKDPPTLGLGHETAAEICVADEDTPPCSDGDASDADSEPIEYAMLDLASRLSPVEASEILRKVRRDSERQVRKEFAEREAAAEVARRESRVVEERLAAASGAAASEDAADGAHLAGASPMAVDFDDQDAADGAHLAGASPMAVDFDDQDVEEEEAGGGARNEVAEDGDDEAETAPAEAAEEVEEEEFEEEAEEAPPPTCLRRWMWLWLPSLVAFAATAVAQPEATFDLLVLRGLRPRYGMALVPECDGIGCDVVDGASEAFRDTADLQERLQRGQAFARARRDWLGGFARTVVAGVATVAIVSLLLALTCWRRIVGAAVAVLAGAVLFVLAVIAADAASGGFAGTS